MISAPDIAVASQSVVGQVNGSPGNEGEHVANSRFPRELRTSSTETIVVGHNDKFRLVRLLGRFD